MKEQITHDNGTARKPRDKRKSSVRMNQRKTMITIPRADYLTLLNIGRKLVAFYEHRYDPKVIEQERITKETIERGHHRPGLGWTHMDHFVPVVSEEWDRKYQRRKEIIRKGTWNPSKKGWEYDGDFSGVWD